MTNSELNRDIKRLAKKATEYNKLNEFNEDTVSEIKKEIVRLYQADSEFKYMNKESIKTLLRLNLSYRPIALYSFGQYINR